MAKRTAEVGDKVAVNLEGRIKNGKVFDTTENDAPFMFTVGDEEIIKGLSFSVLGMSENEVREVQVAPEDGFGDHDKSRVLEIPRTYFAESDFKEGDVCEMSFPGMETTLITVKKIKKDSVIIDTNDPLAGKTLIYKIELLKIF